MDSFDNQLLKVHPDTVMTIRKMYNLDRPGDMDKAVDALEEWLKKQHHLTKRDYPRDFLERSIILLKGSVERAKSQIDKLCSLRVLLPQFFEKYDARNDFYMMDSKFVHAVLPVLTEDHYRVYVGRFLNDGLRPDIFMEFYRHGILISEYLKAHDYCNGFVAIIDYRQVNLVDLIAGADFIALHHFINILMEGYGMRIKGIHAITSSKAIETLISIVKKMFGPKVSSRIHVHTKIESLYEQVPKDILPSDLGGDEKSLAFISEQWNDTLGTKENVNYMQEISKAVSNEAYRMKEKLNSIDLGLAGTFRSLNVD